MAIRLYRDLTDYLFKYHITDAKSIYRFVNCNKECLKIGRRYKTLKQKQLLKKRCCTFFDEETKYYEEYTILPNGNKHGLYTKWYEYIPEIKITPQGIKTIPKRTLAVKCLYDNGKRHGSYNQWFSTGEKQIETSYDNDQYHGSYIEWTYAKTFSGTITSRRILKISTNYYHGKIHGVYKEWSMEELKLVTYNNGVIDGIVAQFYSNNSIRSLTHYVDGKKEGLYQEWYKRTTDIQYLKAEVNYVNDKMDGIYSEWFEENRSQLKKQLTYIDGIPHGYCRTWYVDGKLKLETEYIYGIEL